MDGRHSNASADNLQNHSKARDSNPGNINEL